MAILADFLLGVVVPYLLFIFSSFFVLGSFAFPHLSRLQHYYYYYCYSDCNHPCKLAQGVAS